MGFSVSGATALLLIAFLISFGAFYTATTGAVDQVQDAQVDQNDKHIETLNTDIEIESATWDADDGESGTLTIVAKNTGASTLEVEDTSLLVAGELVPFSDWRTVDRSLWLPQDELTIEIDGDAFGTQDPVGETVRIVTEYGVAATEEIEEESQ